MLVDGQERVFQGEVLLPGTVVAPFVVRYPGNLVIRLNFKSFSYVISFSFSKSRDLVAACRLAT